MRVGALGPVEVFSTDTEVNLGGPKPKALLAALLLEPHQVVSTDRLVDLIWDSRPPQSAVALVHTYVSLLRRRFAEIGHQSVLVTRAPGYVLRMDPSDIDVHIFARHLHDARVTEERDPMAAAGLYRQALAIWRGTAFGGVDAQFARTRAAALEDERLSAEEGLARCELALGKIDEVAARLATLSAAHPLREETRSLLMRALYLSGRQADALATYRDAREHMIDELGVEPSAKLRELHAQLLDGTIAAPPRPSTDAAQVPTPRNNPVANQLPPDVPDFTGRTEFLDRIIALASSTARTPIAVVSGVGGAGKSALAIHCAHLLTKDYPDGQLFADLRGHTVTVGDILGRFLRALGVRGVDLPDDPGERAELFRMQVADRRLIIVLDNARGEHQVRQLLPGAGQCMVIITSRSRLSGIAGAEPIELDFLSSGQSVEMLSRIIGSDRVAGDPEAAATIATLCGGLPLAIRVAGAKLLARGHWPLRALATRLSDERKRLDELTVGDLAIRSSLGLHYDELTAAQRKALHLLALLDLPSFGSWLASPLLGVSLADAEDVVEQLVELRLVEVAGVDTIGRVRYRLHDLIRLYGAEQASVHEPPELVSAAVSRTLAVWTALVETCAAGLPRVTLGLRPTLTPGVELDPRLAEEAGDNPTEWLESETPAVVRAVERAHELGVDEHTATLITSLLSSPFATRNEFDGWQRTHDVALRAARKAGNKHAEAMLLAGLGQLFYEKDDFGTAFDHFQQALDSAVAIGDEAIQAVALVGLGTVQRDLAEFAKAQENLAAAVEIAERNDDRSVLAAATYGLGAISRDHGDLDAATTALSRSVEQYHALGDERGEALALRGLSLCKRAANDYAGAAQLSHQAWLLLDKVGDSLGAMYALQSRAKADIRRGHFDGVRDQLIACLETCTQRRDRFGIALVTRTLGEYALATGDTAEAGTRLKDALDKWTELALPLWQARTLRDLAAVESADSPQEADRLWATAAKLFEQTGGREAGELAGMRPADFCAQVIGNL
jgi:DNA-binding SARP family transcriptional activator/tetratricopeptide (TPR) repeat protein